MKVSLDELEPISESEVKLDDLEAIDAPHNTVFEEKSGRVLALPQTVTPSEAEFLIKKDVDKVEAFFAQQSIEGAELPPAPKLYGPAAAYAPVGSFFRGIGAAVAPLPEKVGGNMLAKAEGLKTGRERLGGITVANPLYAGIGDYIESDQEEQFRKAVGSALEDDALKIVERNRRYMRESGWGKREGDGVMYDLGQGVGSLGISLGVAALTRTPASAALLFGAIQKSDIYLEARSKGMEPDQANFTANVAGVAEAGLEMVGVHHFLKALKGNSAVSRFATGAIIEGIQEGTQQAAESTITNYTGIRDQSGMEIAQDILYNAALGAVIGGTSNVVIGEFVTKEAKDRGLTDEQAEGLGKYARENVDMVRSDVAEFIDKEVAPIAADDARAKEFMTLMQKFDNRLDVVDPATLSPQQREIFDEYVAYFNQAVVNKTGMEAVEKDFFKKQTDIGMAEDRAAASAKLMGAFSDAASRSLGITPMEWYQSQNIKIEAVKRGATEAPQAASEGMQPPDVRIPPEAPTPEDIKSMEDRLTQTRKALNEKTGSKTPLLSWIRSQGGVKLDTELAGELKNMGITSKTHPGIFSKNPKKGHVGELDNIPAVEFDSRFGGAAQRDSTDNYVDRGWLLEQIREELSGRSPFKAQSSVDHTFVRMIEDAGLDINTATAEQVLRALGKNGDIIAAAWAMNEQITDAQAADIRAIMDEKPQFTVEDAIEYWSERQAVTMYQGGLFDPSQEITRRMEESLREQINELSVMDKTDLYRRARAGNLTERERGRLPTPIVRLSDDLSARGVDKTAAGDQMVLQGAERISDRQLAERKMEAPLRSGKEQKGMDMGLFAEPDRQGTLFQRDKNLVVQHNIKLRGLMNVDKLGALPVPSLAVTSKNAPLENFGEITLLGKSDLIDPKKNKASKVFGADVYSPRYPNVSYDYNVKAYRALETNLEQYAQKISEDKADWWAMLPRTDRIEERGVEAFEESAALAAKYIEAVGETLPPPDKYADGRISPSGTARAVVEKARSLGGYQEYAASVAESIITGERIFDGFTPSGNRRYLAHSLDNVVRILKRGLRDGEGFNYGVGSIRSKYAKQFKSIDQIIAAESKIVPSEQFEAINKATDDAFMQLSDKWREFSPLKNEFGFLDAFSEHLKEAATGSLRSVNTEYYGGRVGDEVLAETAQFLDTLRDMPAEYFEAKIQRPVMLQEFEAAVVPNDKKYDAAEALLKKRGLRVIRYDANDKAARAQAISSVEDVFFQEFSDQIRGSITFRDGETLIQLFEGANASTILHEMAHLFLRSMRSIAQQSKRPMVKRDFMIIEKWLGSKNGEFTVEQEEKFARGFELYLREGKAPKEELKGVFERFKEWLTAVYKSIRDLDVSINDDVRNVFDRMLGGDFARTEAQAQQRDLAREEADYQYVAENAPPSSFGADTAAVFRSAEELASNWMAPVSTRLGNIDERLKHAVRKFMFKNGLYSHNDRVAVKGFVEVVAKKFTPEDYRVLDLALKNRNKERVSGLVKKYKIEKEWDAVRSMLDDIYMQALDVGLDMGYIQDYFPRQIKVGRESDFIAAMRGKSEWSEIQYAMEQADPFNTFTDEEKAHFINNYLRGFTSNAINLQRPSFTKERTIDYVDRSMNVFYEDSMSTLLKYISGVRHSIESRKLFGKSAKELDKSIGVYVAKLVKEGSIHQSKEQELKEILKYVVEPTSMSAFANWSKNIGYIYLMGSTSSAITNLGDLAFSFAFNGFYRTSGALLRSIGRKPLLRKEDIGIENILQEFEGNTRATNAVRKVFKIVGVELSDNLGKEVYIDASYRRLVAQNKKGGSEWDAELDAIFGEEAAQVKADLKDGTMSENVKYLLFSEISDVQPISLAEMPLSYLRSGNGRILYMLKTYTVKQIDIYRRHIFDEIASGDATRMIGGLRDLIRLATALMLMQMGTDALKDFLFGRPIKMEDLVTDNILKLMTLTKYQIYKSKEEGIFTTFWYTLFVPAATQIPKDIQMDIAKIGMGDKPLKDSEVAGKVPVVGKFYYWWFGGGRAKIEKEQQKNSD